MKRHFISIAKDSTSGAALVVTLLVVALLTAMVVDFTYAVHMDTMLLENWETSQSASLASRSGVELAAAVVVDAQRGESYTYPGVVAFPPQNAFGGSTETVSLVINDENSKFNLNTIIYPNGLLNKDAYDSLERLLETLSLDTRNADVLADWIDRDSSPRGAGTEDGTKNAPLDSTDELLQIPGLDAGVYDKLGPYVTVYGNGLININGAEAPVIMSLAEDIDEEAAKRVIEFRDITPFRNTTELSRVAGFETLGISLLGRTTVKSSAYRILSDASEEGIIRSIECVMNPSGDVLFWRET